MRQLLALTIILVGGIAACSGPAANNAIESSAQACTPPRAHWTRQAALDAGLTPPINYLSVDRNGAIYWNGQPSNVAHVSEFLAVVATMNPRPHTFLETEMGAPCALVERVRDEMDRRLNCRAGGQCAEGIWRVWQQTRIPAGTPPS